MGVEPATHNDMNQAKAVLESKGSQFELQVSIVIDKVVVGMFFSSSHVSIILSRRQRAWIDSSFKICWNTGRKK